MVAPFGSWKSPITADLIVAETIGLNGIVWDGEDLYWLESRPAEAGRNVLVRRTKNGEIADITPPPFNVRTRVHEYGGGAFLITSGTVYFVNFSDQRLYRQIDGGTPQPLTAESPRRYADFTLDKSRHRLICVVEDHSQSTPDSLPINMIASIDLETGEENILASGGDFYSSPRLSPDGGQLAWLTWNHPNMPWDESELWLAEIAADGSLAAAQCVAGGPGESVGEPKWSPDGQLYFSSDRNGWWNLYRSKDGEIEPLWEMEAEFAYPHWIFAISTYDFADDQRLICTYTQNGCWYLASLDLLTKQLQPMEVPYSNISSLKVRGNTAAFLGASPQLATCAVQLHLETGETTIGKQSSDWEIPTGYLSIPEAIAFPTDGGLTAYAWYYPPQNQDYGGGLSGELPPLLVKSHGGPTAAASNSLNLRVQYWTSRGFAYLDVNYGGSTGYGRQYRQRLEGQWGIVDVRDCINAAKYLVAQGKVDGDRLAISGGSAGGYTTLMALTFDDTFRAGASYYGVSDLAALAADTHKFESRYLERLVGPYPEALAVYQGRSPIYHAERLSCPIIFFQGLEDRVVPPSQTEMMVAAMEAKGLPVAYVAFEGEQHGFRQAENIKRALEGELYFYSRIFGFEPAEAIAAITIQNASTHGRSRAVGWCGERGSMGAGE